MITFNHPDEALAWAKQHGYTLTLGNIAYLKHDMRRFLKDSTATIGVYPKGGKGRIGKIRNLVFTEGWD